jgi:hypothetical protein
MRLLTVLTICACMSFAQSPQLKSNDGANRPLGNLNTNPLDPNSVANPLGRYGSSLSPDSVNNPLGIYGSSISPYSAKNPLATQAPKIVTPDGKYLGTFGANPLAPDSVSNPIGRYGSPISPDSINNPIGIYGSPVSPNSATNPFSTGYAVPVFPHMPSPSMPTVKLPRIGGYGLDASPNASPAARFPQPAVSFPQLPQLPALPSLPRLPELPKLPNY